INVTPMVDVMLVLLIIFMVAAPIATPSIKINLPKTAVETGPDRDPIFVDVAQNGDAYIGPRKVALSSLNAEVDALAGHTDAGHARIMIRGDGAMDYADLMRVMNTLQDGGHYRVGLISEKL
ncbi:MAG: biopolymer transporter ExbD, partial [Caulobacteraceae bacterium]